MKIDTFAFYLMILFVPVAAVNAADAKLPTEKVSKKGNVTGGACRMDSECIEGCVGKKEPTCISKSEGSNKCLEGKSMPPGGLACSCLDDVHMCGYRFPNTK